MKKNLLYSLLLPFFILLLQSCEKRDFLDGTLSPYIAIEDVRMIHRGTDIRMNADLLLQAEKTTGVVISDHTAGNVPEGTIVIQQWRQGTKLHGISLKVGDIASDYSIGDSIIVNISNKELKRDGFLYVDNVTASDIEVVAKVDRLLRRTVTGASAYQRPNDFESTLVKIIGGEIYPRPVEGDTFSGTKRMLSGADTLTIQTQPSATFANMQLPRNINVAGILLQSANTSLGISIWPRYALDIEDVSDPDIPEGLGDMPLVITGFCNDPSGGDANYEYVQLLANTDIDFTEIPFSLVISNNAGTVLHSAGWATGASKTFKFNLTEGSVKKGEFFYVGGHQKRINGANSTSIAGANWIRSFQYGGSGSQGFDGLGDPNDNILANSGNAGGIALFVGTNISEATVPVDVIFFGGFATASIIDLELNRGYRITNNDHYSTYNEEADELTPFFSMGENKNNFRFAHHGGATNTDIGYFFKLGGRFDTEARKWVVPRERTLVFLQKNASLIELETGDGITVQIN